MLDSHIKIIDYIPLFDYVKPSVSVLKNEKKMETVMFTLVF